MYIEKLTNEEIKDIARMLIGIVEDNPRALEYKLEHLVINREYYKDEICCSFPTEYETHACFITDFDAEIDYGSSESPSKITRAYRRYMYQKFGVEYKIALDKFYREPIEAKYKKEIDKLNNQINEMTQ